MGEEHGFSPVRILNRIIAQVTNMSSRGYESNRLSLEEFSRVVNIGNSQRMGGLAEIKNCINQCISRY